MKTSNLRPALIVAVVALTACSGPNPTTDSATKSEKEKAESAAPPAPVTAKTAFWEMYKSACLGPRHAAPHHGGQDHQWIQE